MIEKLTPEQIVYLVRTTPEQIVFDWKREFSPPTDDESKGEIVKDLMAIANGTGFTHRPGFVVYGVDPLRADCVVGVAATWDDASLQQLAASVLDPVPDFLLYDVDAGDGRTVVVMHVPRSRPFHVVSRNLGKLREGQSMIRQGSSTRGVTRDDQIQLYLTPGNGYVEQVLQKYNAAANMAHAENNRIALLGGEAQRLEAMMRSMAGLG